MQQGQGPRPAVALEALPAGPPTERAVLAPGSWDRMMVTSVPGTPPHSGAVPTGLAAALTLIDSAYRAPGGAGGRRAVPSAGALHPYECYVLAYDAEYPAVFFVDAVRGRVHRSLAGPRGEALLRRAGTGLPPDGGALVVVVTRPWLSMRKYGDRGYLYTHLDAGHLAANLLGLAAELAPDARLDLDVRREPLADLLGVRDRCREVHSVLRLGRPRRPVGADGWSLRDLGGGPAAAGAEQPSWLERMCWRSLRPLTGDAPAAPPADTRAPARPLAGWARSGGPGLADGAGQPGRWLGLSRARRSVKGFADTPLDGGAVRRVMAAAGTPLAVGLPGRPSGRADGEGGAGRVRITLVARSVTGMAPGVYRSEGEHAAVPPLPDAEVARACMQQEHLGNAAAVVLLHTPRQGIVGRPPAAMREALFRAGALGQLLYLGACEAGIGVTGVGGFDTQLWRRMGCLPDHDELLYLLTLGTDAGADAGVKWDRAQIPYAQRVR